MQTQKHMVILQMQYCNTKRHLLSTSPHFVHLIKLMFMVNYTRYIHIVLSPSLIVLVISLGIWYIFSKSQAQETWAKYVLISIDFFHLNLQNVRCDAMIIHTCDFWYPRTCTYICTCKPHFLMGFHGCMGLSWSVMHSIRRKTEQRITTVLRYNYIRTCVGLTMHI